MNLAKREIVTVGSHVEVFGKGVHSLNHIRDSISDDVAFRGDLVGGQIIVTDETLTRLINIETVGELLATEEKSEGISAVVGTVTLTDFKRVVSKIVVNDIVEVVSCGEEAQDSAIIVQELLLGLNFATTKALLHEVSHFRVPLWWDGIQDCSKLSLGELDAGGSSLP